MWRDFWKFFRKKILSSKDEHFVLSVSVVFYILSFFNLNNKTLLGLFAVFIFIFWRRLKDLSIALFIVYLLFLPFGKGKTFDFVLIPAWALGGNSPFTFGFSITFADLAALGLMALIIKREILGRWKTHLNFVRLDFFIFAFLLSVFTSIFFSHFQIVSFLDFLKLLRIVAIYYVVQIVFQEKSGVKFIPLVLAATLSFQGVWTSLQFIFQGPLRRSVEFIDEGLSQHGYLAREESSFFRAQGTFEHPNTLAAFLVILLSFFLIQILNPKVDLKIKKIWMASFIIGLLGLMFSGSRASWAVFSFMAILGIGFLRRRKKFCPLPMVKRWALAILLALLALFPFIILPRIFHFYSTFSEQGGVYYRTYLLEKAWFVAQDAPLGIGLATFPQVLVEKFGFFAIPTPAHNLFLEILSETGIFSLLFFCLFLIFAYKRFFVNLRNMDNVTFFFKSGTLLATLGFLGVAQFYPFFASSTVFEYFWLFLGMMLYPK